MLKKFIPQALIAMTTIAGVSSFAAADIIDYTTVGTFGSSGTNSISGGGITLTFDELTAGNSVNTGTLGATFASVGDFDLNVSTNSSTSFSMSDTFTLTVDQTVPGPGGSASFGIGTVSGTVTANASGATVTFSSPLSVMIPGSTADVTYALRQATDVIVPTTTNSGVTSVQATISSVDHGPLVPTPASLVSGSALLGGLFIAKRRNRKNIA